MPICTPPNSSDHHIQQTAHPRDRRWTWFVFEVSPEHPGGDPWGVQLSQTAPSMCCTDRASVRHMPVKFFPAWLPEEGTVSPCLSPFDLLPASPSTSWHNSARGQRRRDAKILQVLPMESPHWHNTLSLWGSRPCCPYDWCLHCHEQLLLF